MQQFGRGSGYFFPRLMTAAKALRLTQASHSAVVPIRCVDMYQCDVTGRRGGGRAGQGEGW